MFNNLKCKFDLPKLLIVFESFSVYWKKMFAAFVDVDKTYICV